MVYYVSKLGAEMWPWAENENGPHQQLPLLPADVKVRHIMRDTSTILIPWFDGFNISEIGGELLPGLPIFASRCEPGSKH